jgi:hypothetical protein
MLPRALDWAAARPRPLEPPTSGLLASVFSHLLGADGTGGLTSAREAVGALARGLGAHMAPGARAEFALELAR